jgi:hypothetical protein
MRKKLIAKRKRLVVSAETLRALSVADLGAVAGGFTDKCQGNTVAGCRVSSRCTDPE